MHLWNYLWPRPSIHPTKSSLFGWLGSARLITRVTNKLIAFVGMKKSRSTGRKHP